MIRLLIVLLAGGMLVLGVGAYRAEAEAARAEERPVALVAVASGTVTAAISTVRDVAELFRDAIDETKRVARATELRSIQQAVDIALVVSGKPSVAALPNFGSITAENYETGPYREYLHSPPMCNYTVSPAGKVSRSPNQPDTCK